MLGEQLPIVGREHELALVEAFTAAVAAGPASLVLDGPAGIGKTAIWGAAVNAARTNGVAVRTCRCTEADGNWAFSGLGDLFDGVGSDVTAHLPEIQRRALASTLLVSDEPGDAPGNRVVAMAVLGVLRALSAEGPVLLGIDDIQWLDSSSRSVLSFALRRLRDEPIRLLASCRTGPSGIPVADAALGLVGERLMVGAASVGSLQRMVQTRLDQTLSRPTLTRLHQATGGNPMMFLEMARALQRRGSEPRPEEALPVPADLRVLVAERLRDLGPRTRELLLLTGALAQPTVATVTSLVRPAAAGAAALAEALDAGVLERDGERLRFTHPLIASIPYDDLAPAARRRVHEQLVAVVSDPEQRARHLALAAVHPSTSVAASLDAAAAHARGRGSLDKAAELAQLAVTATPADRRSDLLRRTVKTAEFLFLLGETARAREVVSLGLDAVIAGPERVPGLLLRATIASWEQGDATVAQWCQQALTEAGDSPLLLARCHATFAELSPSGAELDLMHAQVAVGLLESLDNPPSDVLSNALTNLALHGCRLGQGLSVVTLERAVALQNAGMPPPVSDRPGMALGICLKVVDRFEDSREWLRAMRTSAVEEGDDSALPVILGHLGILECWSGDFVLALRHAMEGREHAVRIGLRAPMAESAHVLALAHMGRIDEARAIGQEDLSTDEALGFDAAVALHSRSLGFTELAADNASAAATHLQRALRISRDQIGIGEPAIMRLHADAVEALIAVDSVAAAEQLTAELDASADRNAFPWATAMAARCHGLVCAASGDIPGAAVAFERALVAHERLGMPFEEARTRLLLGVALRRAGRRTEARLALDSALTTFVRIGAPVHAGHVRAELAGFGGKPSSDGSLTAAELRIVALVGAGQTSREVGSALSMSVRTVDTHLGRIYRKLGLRSRTELARWLASQSGRSSS